MITEKRILLKRNRNFRILNVKKGILEVHLTEAVPKTKSSYDLWYAAAKAWLYPYNLYARWAFKIHYSNFNSIEKVADEIWLREGQGRYFINVRGYNKTKNKFNFYGKGSITLIPKDKLQTDYIIKEQDMSGFRRYKWWKK